MHKGKKNLINWLGLLGIISLASYIFAVALSPLAYPGYDWKSQAVSDLSALSAPSLALWSRLSSLYGLCGVVSATLAWVYAQGRLNKPIRTGISLFALMNWVSGVGYAAFPLSESGFAGSFQDIMHGYVVTPLVVILSIASLAMIIVGGFKDRRYLSMAACASISFAFMLIGAIGVSAAPKEVFGVFERFSLFSAVGFNGALGVFLFKGFFENEESMKALS